MVAAEVGAKIGEVDAALQPHNLVVHLGMHPDTGIGGLTLGGGIGWLTPRAGLAIDNLMSAEVVLADGLLVTADKDNHSELCWAMKGGGGNFRVVVSFTHKVYKVGGADGFKLGMLLGSIIPFPLELFDWKTVIEKYAEDCFNTSNDNIKMLLLPNGGAPISVFTYHSTIVEVQTSLDELGTGYVQTLPPKDGVKPINWTAGVQMLTAMGDPNGQCCLLALRDPFYHTAITSQLAAFLLRHRVMPWSRLEHTAMEQL